MAQNLKFKSLIFVFFIIILFYVFIFYFYFILLVYFIFFFLLRPAVSVSLHLGALFSDTPRFSDTHPSCGRLLVAVSCQSARPAQVLRRREALMCFAASPSSCAVGPLWLHAGPPNDKKGQKCKGLSSFASLV